MKTVLLLLSIVGLALVCAELQHDEDQYIEDAAVVAVDDSADSRRGSYDKDKAEAFFTSDNIEGKISVRQEKGAVKWNVDLRNVNYAELCPLECSTKDCSDGNDFFWHIHEKWTSTASEAYGADCGSANTGGHYDPTYGCGGASQHQSGENIQNAPIAYFASDGTNGPNSPITVTGSAATSITSDGKIRLDWTLTGLDKGSSGGIHIHYGTTCDTEATIKGDAPAGANKGHYYVPDATPDASEDPWGPVKWESDVDGIAKGSIEISKAELGVAAVSSAYNRVVIVHNSAGGKIGCGVLASPTTACTQLGRGKAEGQQQTCAGADLETAAGRALCEYGDQSSKLGKLVVKNGKVKERKNQKDDEHMDSVDNIRGLSIVLHCGGDKSRTACAKLN